MQMDRVKSELLELLIQIYNQDAIFYSGALRASTKPEMVHGVRPAFCFLTNLIYRE